MIASSSAAARRCSPSALPAPQIIQRSSLHSTAANPAYCPYEAGHCLDLIFHSLAFLGCASSAGFTTAGLVKVAGRAPSWFKARQKFGSFATEACRLLNLPAGSFAFRPSVCSGRRALQSAPLNPQYYRPRTALRSTSWLQSSRSKSEAPACAPACRGLARRRASCGPSRAATPPPRGGRSTGSCRRTRSRPPHSREGLEDGP